MSRNQTINSIGDWVARHTDLGALFDDFQQSFSELSQLPRTVLPLCRIRVAQLHGNKGADTYSDSLAELSEEVSQWPASDKFSDGEKACLAFAEVYAMDVHAITDAQADAVKQFVGEPGLVALVQALGVIYAEVRLDTLWGFSGALRQPGQIQ